MGSSFKRTALAVVSPSYASDEMRPQLEREAEETRARLSSAYKAMEKDPLSCPDELLAATCAFVTRLKARGLPPEKMLVTLKATLAEISEAWISRDGKHFIGPEIAENVYREVILTAIKHYFGAEHRCETKAAENAE